MRKWIVAAALIMTAVAVALGAASEENRDRSLIYFGYSPLGLDLPTLISRPAGIGVYLGHSLLVGAEIGSHTYSYSSGTDRADATYSNSGIYARWFPGTNSFNLLLGVHRRAWEAAAMVTIKSTAGSNVQVNGDLKAETTVASLGIGNQWMSDWGITWGVDWLMLNSVVGSSSKAKVTGSASGIALSATDTQTAQKDLADLGTTLNKVSGLPGVLVFSIGWSF